MEETKKKEEEEKVTPGRMALMESVLKPRHRATIEERDPMMAMKALELMASGRTQREVEAATGMTFETQRLLRARNERPFAVRRAELALDGFELAEGFRMLALQKQADLAEDKEQMREVNVRDLAISFAITQDKAMAALGENAQRIVVEHRKGASIEDAQAEIEAAKERARGMINVTATGEGAAAAKSPERVGVPDKFGNYP